MRLITVVLLASLVGLSTAGKERLFKLKPRLSGQNARSIIIINSINMISISMISITYTLQDVVSKVVQSLSLV